MLRKAPSRLLLVSEPGTDGVFLIVRQLIRFLHQNHPEVSVDWAYSSRRSSRETFALADEVRSRGGEAVDLRVGHSPEPRDVPALLQLLRLVRRRSPQVVHAHSSKAGGLCRLLALLPGFPPVLYSPHAYYGMAGKRGVKEKFYNLLETFFGRSGCSHVVSSDERRFALKTLKLPARSLVLINNGILADRFAPGDETAKSDARTKLGLPQNGKLLITVGRDCPQKNYAPLYAALNRFLVEQPSIHFAHAGAGALKCREKLDAAIRGRCHSFEHMEDTRSMFLAADGFILTSFYEGMSLSMLEAISCGLPLLLTDAVGLSVVRAYGLKVDWLPDPNHCADFEAEVLKTLIAWSGRPSAILSNQHELVRRNFNTPIQFGKIVRLYESLVEKAGTDKTGKSNVATGGHRGAGEAAGRLMGNRDVMVTKSLARILFISEPGTDGVFFYVRDLVRFLHQHHPEITVDLAYSSRRFWPETRDFVNEIRSHGGEVIDLRVGNSPELRDLAALGQLWRLVRRRSPQLIYAISSKAGGLGRLLALLPGFPPVLYAPQAYYGMAHKGGIMEKFYNFLELLLGRIGHSHIVSSDERHFALKTLKLPARSLFLIYNGIPADQFLPRSEAAMSAARVNLGIPQDRKLLITIGRDSPQKNYAPLYAALNRFLAEQPLVHFAHAGAGALQRRETLDAAVRQRCHSFEYVEDTRSLLWAADGFILTSFYEGMSLSMLEAISCGLPLLLADAPGLSAMRDYGLKVDWLPNPNLCADFEAEVLKALIAWGRRPSAISLSQHEFVQHNFNRPIQFGKVVRVYEWLMKKA